MKPTMLDQSYYETANEIISRYPLEEKSLIPIIQDIQATYRYLPAGSFGLCGQKDRHYRDQGLQRGQLL